MAESAPFRSIPSAPLATEGPPTNPKYEELLERQIALADRQLADLEREEQIRFWSPRIRHISDVMKATFQVGIGLGVFLLLIIAGVAVWRAAHANSLVIEPFSVPSDLSARGLTGQALAAQLQDELSALQEATDTARPANSYSNNWGQDIKVEIPNTGMSVSEAYRLLVSWLGHETHITGEVYRTPSGLVVKTRISGTSGTLVKGSEVDFDKLLRQAAETIYRRTQPYRYAIYAGDNGRRAESLAVLEQLATDDSQPQEQAWAYLGLGEAKTFAGDFYGGVADLRRAVARFPDLASLYVALDNNELWLGHDEEALAAARKAVALLRSGRDTAMSARARAITLPVEEADAALYANDYPTVLRFSKMAINLPDYASLSESSREAVVVAHALLHDVAAAEDAWRALPSDDDALVQFSRMGALFAKNIWLGNWHRVVGDEAMVDKRIDAVENNPAYGGVKLGIFRKTLFWPYLAYARAMTGDFGRAHALIDKTPLDCFLCLRVRGAIAAQERNWNGAQYWYERAVKAGPSIPTAYTDWGRMLLAKGNPDEAIAKFRAALLKQPRYADAHAGWGEALMAKNRSDLAIAEFGLAAQIAPNWGRLHLKWAEALTWSGRKNDAKVEFSKAMRLHLTPAENRERLTFR